MSNDDVKAKYLLEHGFFEDYSSTHYCNRHSRKVVSQEWIEEHSTEDLHSFANEPNESSHTLFRFKNPMSEDKAAAINQRLGW